MVVKVADTEREKNARRLQQTVAGLGGVNNLGLSAAAFGLSTLGAAAYYQQVYTRTAAQISYAAVSCVLSGT